MAKHELAADSLHYCWDNSIAPRLEIEAGDTVLFQTQDAGDGQIQPGCTAEEYSRRVFKGHPLTGPVFIKGAQPGDTLVIEIQHLETVKWGWTGFRPTAGLLRDDFPEPYVHIWQWDNPAIPEGWAEFKPGIRVPREPFCGVMGLAWNEPGQHSTVPPRAAGGNMDIKQLTVGSILQLPVTVEGGLFSVGDCHAAQGDGEVCVSAIETAGEVELHFTLQKQTAIREPRFWTGKQSSPRAGEKGYFVTTAHAPDLFFASQQAIRYMIEYLVDTHHLTAQEAYILSSVAVDLKISQIVDGPNWTVSAFLPNAIFQ